MAQKMTGALVFDERTDRYDIRFDLNSYYGGLHCRERQSSYFIILHNRLSPLFSNNSTLHYDVLFYQ